MINEIFEDCIYDIDGAINFVKQNGYDGIILQEHSAGYNNVTYYIIKKKFKGKVIILVPCNFVTNNMNYSKAR